MMSAIALAVNIVIGLPSLSQTTRTPRPCDIYGSAGTPCAAAHSMTRALYASYNGPLYQVQRASDNAIQDIGLLSIGGYANAAAQDSFCSGTTCYVTKIYDQTRNHNDLTKAARYLAQADAWPLTIAGHRAYGLKIIAGSGWGDNDAYGKHDFTTGVPTGAQPEGTYMVTSGSFTGGDCCFDYGNTEMAEGIMGRATWMQFPSATTAFSQLAWAPAPGSGMIRSKGYFSQIVALKPTPPIPVTPKLLLRA
jgi:hypothetical protein